MKMILCNQSFDTMQGNMGAITERNEITYMFFTISVLY